MDGLLHQADTDACCHLRKVQPLTDALAEFRRLDTGRKRFQSGTRADIPHFEKDARKIKINPLATWTRDDIAAYITKHKLPRHPLVAQGYPIDRLHALHHPRRKPRRPARRPLASDTAKTECGIHFEDGKSIQTRSRRMSVIVTDSRVCPRRLGRTVFARGQKPANDCASALDLPSDTARLTRWRGSTNAPNDPDRLSHVG